MQMPSTYWEMTYSASRRKHNHRCTACNKIVADGERVYMARLGAAKTRVLHKECAHVVSFNNYTHLQYLEAHAMMYLAMLGHKDAKAWLNTAEINKPVTGRA